MVGSCFPFFATKNLPSGRANRTAMPCQSWAVPPVRLGLPGRNSRKIPERPRKRSQSVSWNSPREYGWDAPNPIIQAFGASRAFPELSPPQYGWGRLFFQNWFRRGPLRAGHGIPSSTEGISEILLNTQGLNAISHETPKQHNI